MKKAGIAGGLIALLMLLPVCSGVAVAGEKNGLETAAIGDIDFVVLAKSSSTTVTADIGFPLAFEFIPVIVVGDGTGAFTASVSRTNTTGELIYIYQRFPGARAAAFNIGITPVTIRVSSAVTLGPGWAAGYVVTGILFSPEKPPYEYSVSLGF
jgi:hypothetical protein